MLPDKIFDISIYIPHIDDYIEVIGAKCERIDGKQYLRLVCKGLKDEYLLNPGDVEIYFKRYSVPF